MNAYHYSNGQKILFSCDALTISEADALCTAAGFKPMSLACGIGWNLIAYDSSKARTLVVLTDSGRCVESSVFTHHCYKGTASLPTLLLPPNEAAMSLYKTYRYNPDVTLFLEAKVNPAPRHYLRTKVVDDVFLFDVKA